MNCLNSKSTESLIASSFANGMFKCLVIISSPLITKVASLVFAFFICGAIAPDIRLTSKILPLSNEFLGVSIIVPLDILYLVPTKIEIVSLFMSIAIKSFSNIPPPHLPYKT